MHISQAIYYHEIEEPALFTRNSCESDPSELYDNSRWAGRSIAGNSRRERTARFRAREKQLDRSRSCKQKVLPTS